MPILKYVKWAKIENRQKITHLGLWHGLGGFYIFFGLPKTSGRGSFLGWVLGGTYTQQMEFKNFQNTGEMLYEPIGPKNCVFLFLYNGKKKGDCCSSNGLGSRQPLVASAAGSVGVGCSAGGTASGGRGTSWPGRPVRGLTPPGGRWWPSGGG